MFELLALIGIVFIIAIFLRSPPKGNVGENRVSYKVQSFTKKNNESESFDNVILKTPDGTTQIDHIIISIYGIFVIELKIIKGGFLAMRTNRSGLSLLLAPEDSLFLDVDILLLNINFKTHYIKITNI